MVGRELEEPPHSLAGTNVPSVHVTGDLVVRRSHRNGRTVRSLIDILVDILDRLYRSANLDIHMRTELLEEVRVIRDYPAVIADDLLVREARFAGRKRLAIVPAAVLWVAVLVDYGTVRKCLGEPL